MDALSSPLRRELERAVVAAHDKALFGATSALRRHGVDAKAPYPHFSDADKALRKRLRYLARNLGDVKQPDNTHTIEHAAQELAYEYWHRMLFSRFLAENGLLMHPDGVSVSLEECHELAAEADPPAPNGFVLAARYASRMLPQIFRTDDVLLEIEFAPEYRKALEQILDGLPAPIFRASESLGWSYQFWQSKAKDQINKSGEKIDGSTVAPVTQLFTETYMVEFLLHNTIGAWWVSRHPDIEPPVKFEYLRRLDDGTPAAGSFPGWPDAARDVTMLDPCCGSYHFLVTAFKLLVPLRQYEEGLTLAEAIDAVLSENLHGIDIDPCCSKISAFSLAFVAWTMPDETGTPLGSRPLPTLNIACSGQALDETQRAAWLKFANGDVGFRSQIDDLLTACKDCYHVGSLIDPVREYGSLFCDQTAALMRNLTEKLAKYERDTEASAVGVAAQKLAKAADILSGRYTLVATNVPYLGRGKQADVIKDYLDRHYPLGKGDLATAFVLRCLELCSAGGSAAVVTPQNWLFLTSYKKMREELLKKRQWNLVAQLGEHAFESAAAAGAFVAMQIISAVKPADDQRMAGMDVSAPRGQKPIYASEKAERLANRVPTPVQVVRQAMQLRNPDARVAIAGHVESALLQTYATSYLGLGTGDFLHYGRCFWEFPHIPEGWTRHQTAVDQPVHWGGMEHLVAWDRSVNRVRGMSNAERVQIHNQDQSGQQAWGRKGVAVSLVGELKPSLYTSERFDKAIAAIIPVNQDYLPALWTFCASAEFQTAVRTVDQKVMVTNATLVKIPFDLAYWQAVAAEKYPNGLPEPHSDDPTQWLFRGDIATSTDPLQVAVARLLGYRWPDQPTEAALVDSFVDDDGIVCLPGVRSEPPAAERLADILRAVGYKTEVDLGAWLRDKFFEDHCRRFHQRPFLWHIWDGRKDGFAALVNYHTLTHKALENLTFSYLGDWITAQNKSDKVGADLRLAAAQALQAKLKLILAGEPPYDIFVRWKPIHEQSIGWHPDLNDGVRMNIRPFVEADILRKTPNIKWTKDRGKEPGRDKDDYSWFWPGGTFTGDRVNDVHLTNAQKQAARDRVKEKGDRP